MSRKRVAKKADTVATDILFAMFEGFDVAFQKNRLLDNAELYALVMAFKQAKPYMNKKAIADFAVGVMRLVDMDGVRADDDEYPETFELFIESLVS